MTASAPDLEQIRRNSRHGAIMSVAGAAIVFVALAMSIWQVVELQNRRASLLGEIQALNKQKADLRAAVVADQDKRELALAQLAQNNTRLAEEILAPSPAPSVQAPATTVRSPGATPSSARVYFQIRSLDQVALYTHCKEALGSHGYRIPSYQLLSVGPSSSELRYFRDSERERALQLKGDAEKCLGSSLTLKQVRGYPNAKPFYFEVWLAPQAG